MSDRASKQITVQYFALFRERVGLSEEMIDSMAATAAELFEDCQSRHPGLESFSTMKVAINDELAEWSTPISDQDRVLFFPPVAGG